MTPLEILYSEYKRLTERTEKQVDTITSDFKLLGSFAAIGPTVLTFLNNKTGKDITEVDPMLYYMAFLITFFLIGLIALRTSLLLILVKHGQVATSNIETQINHLLKEGNTTSSVIHESTSKATLPLGYATDWKKWDPLHRSVFGVFMLVLSFLFIVLPAQYLFYISKEAVYFLVFGYETSLFSSYLIITSIFSALFIMVNVYVNRASQEKIEELSVYLPHRGKKSQHRI